MNNKTYTILQSFDKYEVNRLRKFLQSPYFNMNESIVQLFEVFIKNIFSKSQKKLTKEIIWKKVYSNKSYDDVRFRKLNSELLKLVEKFLAQHIYEENPIRQATYLIEAVGEKKLIKLYNNSMRTARRLTEQQKQISSNFYFYQYEIEKNYYELTQMGIKRYEKANEEIIAKNLDFFYLSERLRILNGILSRNYELDINYSLPLTNEIIDHIKANYEIYEENPLILIYFTTYLIYTEPEKEDHYFELKKLLAQNSHLFLKKAANDMYIEALNYCSRKINKGNQVFLREYFELYNDLISKEIIIENGELAPWHFKNIIVVGLRLGEFNWTEKFINEYNEKLPLNFRENAVTYNTAQLHFYQKNYTKVIRLLNQVEYEDLAYNLNSKLMLIAVYYETDEIEPLYSLFESFRVYLNRKKSIPAARKRRYLNLIKYTKKLTKLMPGDKKAKEKLITEIAETEGGIINLKWLKEKIAEL